MNAFRLRGWLLCGGVACWAAFAVWGYTAPHACKPMSRAAQAETRAGQFLGCNFPSNQECRVDPACVAPQNVDPNVGCNGSCLVVNTPCGIAADGTAEQETVAVAWTSAASACVGCGFDNNNKPLCPNTGCYQDPQVLNTRTLCVDKAVCNCEGFGFDNYGNPIVACKDIGDGVEDQYVDACFEIAQ